MISQTIDYLKNKNKILFITTSNRWKWSHEVPKSTQLAQYIAKQIGEDKVTIFDISQMQIYPCEGNVSWLKGNSCWTGEANLKDPKKNPSWCHRCRASLNNPDDELRKISKALLASEVVVFLTSIRWGQTNSMYQKLIERLTRLENRHTTLGEENIIKHIEAWIIIIGHNRNKELVLATQKKTLEMFGFKVSNEISQWRTFTDMTDETQKSYQAAVEGFEKDFWFILKK